MNTMSISYPESLPEGLHLSSSEFEREARLATAVVSARGRRRNWCGVPCVHFLHELGRWSVSTQQVDGTALDNDLAVASRLHDRH